MSIGHGSNIIEKSWTDDLLNLINRYTKLDHSHNVPLAGGISKSAATVYLDQAIPQSYLERGVGKRVPASKYLRIHEFVEKAVMDALVKLGANPRDVYLPAHAVGNAAEEAAVENDGYMLSEYGRFWDKWIPVAAKHKLGDGTPQNLELKPYENE